MGEFPEKRSSIIVMRHNAAAGAVTAALAAAVVSGPAAQGEPAAFDGPYDLRSAPRFMEGGTAILIPPVREAGPQRLASGAALPPTYQPGSGRFAGVSFPPD